MEQVRIFVPFRTKPPHDQKSICVRAMPLGTLLHIAAGNVDGLPAFSLAEGAADLKAASHR